MIISYGTIYGQSSDEEVKKEANRLFEEDEFTSAYKLYAQLVANFPKDPEYNFRLGVCMIYSEPDKKKSIPYLNLANNAGPESPKETKFYLGKAYHINYQFDLAIKFYNDYKKIGSSSKQKKLQVDREIKACVYGKRLLSNLSDLVVVSKKTLNEADYFRTYDLKNIGGKLLVKPSEWQSGPDKRKKDKSIIYKPGLGDRIYFSSYGSNTDNGRDIYYKVFLSNGEYGPAIKVKGINTEFDEDYPFLHPNGNTLYFASKGHNSMGGYDIFKSTYIAATDSWSQPVNLEFPINSPDDDFLYVTDSLEKTAYFSTGRQSLPGKIDVLKINTERKPIDVLAIKGTVVKESSEQSLKSVVTVKNMGTGQIVGTYSAQDNGDYTMDLPNGAKLLYTVETPGLKTQSDRVLLPLVATSKPLRQTISYEKGILKIINYFDEATSDESYIQYLKIIEQKAKLNVNVGENTLKPELVNADTASSGNTVVKNETEPATNTDTAGTKSVVTNTSAVNNKQSLTNKQLQDIAKQDAEESKKEADKLKQDSWDAFELGNAKKIEADKKMSEADEAFKNAQAITNEDDKKLALEKANEIKSEAEVEQTTANKILSYAKTLDEDAKNKQKEADLNKQYSQELEKIIASKNTNKESLKKLDDLQKQISDASSKKNESDNIYNAIKNDVEEKEKEISKIEQKNTEEKTNLEEIKTSVTGSQTDLAKAKKKEKPEIEEKINELKTEQIAKEKQINDNELQIKKLKDELAGLKNELDLANKIKTETIAVNTNSSSITENTTTANNNSTEIKNNTLNNNPGTTKKITNQTLADNYKDKVVITDKTEKTTIEESTTQLKNYNKDIDVAVGKNKSYLANAKNDNAKQEIAAEIKKLEATKRENQRQIAANNKLVDDLNKSISASTTKNNNTYLNPISSNNTNDAVKQLNTLNEQLNGNDNVNFEYNGYQNSQAQNLKIEADAKINEVAAQQKKLKDLIASTKEQIQSTANTNTVAPSTANTPSALNKEADEIIAKAQEYRNEAKTKEGTEKENLIAKAKEEEKKADEKHLQASELLANDNKAIYDTNEENILTLKKENKATDSDINEVNRLIEEANTAYKQAVNMRQEANSLPNIGAKLGNLGNAEEKEAEALDKQNQALFILSKTSKNVALKTAITSANKPANNSVNTATVNLSPQLETVNAGISELANSKLIAYQKLYDANKSELEQINNTLKTNQALIDKTPSFKNSFIAGNNKITKAEGLKQSSETSIENNTKLNDLITATKIQIDAINQLNNLNKNLNLSIAKNTNNTNNNGTESANSNTTTANNTNTTVAVNTNTLDNNNTNNGNETVNTNTSTANNTNTITENNNGTESANTKTTTAKNTNTITDNSNNGNETVTTNTPSANTNTVSEGNNTQPVDTKTVDVNELAKKDTTINQVVDYFNTNKTTLKNPGANQLVKNTIVELKKIEEENKVVEEEIKTLNANNNSGNETSAQLKTKAENLLVEAEELGSKSFELKKQANEKNGAEKDTLLAKSKALDDLSQTKKLEAVTLTDKGNQQAYTTNNNAIQELTNKAKTDNPSLIAQLEQKNIEIATLKTQAQQIRNEANNLTNNNAKIGAIMNAEEKENEMLQKQNEVIEEFKKQYPDYIVKESNTNATNATPENLKQKQNQIREKQYAALTNLTNAFSLEYETSKNNVPANLNESQKIVQLNADELNAESKRLLIKASGETNELEKVKLLTLSSKTGNAAVEQLNKITKPANSVANNTNNAANNNRNNTNTNTANNNRNNNTANNTNNNARNNANTNANNTANNNRNNTNNNTANNTARNNNPNNTARNNANNNATANTNARNNNTVNNARGTVKIDGLEVINGNAYNANKPIPMDAKMEDGLVFRVQIGAFKTALPNNAFRGLSPVNGETASNGYLRYTAGNFNKIENANAVKNDLRGLGYNDAFVVVYFNGKRITLNEALAILAKEGKTVDNSAPQTVGINANSNIPKVTNNPANPNLNAQDAVTVTKELEQINGLLYTIQIGVYSKQVKQQQLFNLRPIYSEKLTNGLFRYTAGIYNNAEKLITDKNRVITFGVRDAFVSAYLNGKRISFAEGKTKQQDSATKMEPENPIIFPDGNANNTAPINTAPPANNTNPPTNNTAPATTVQPFTNGVSSYPTATPENGIKASQDGVCFKVQIGAYSKQVPNDVAAKFSAIKAWPVENKQINALFIYNIGNFTSAKFAKTLKDEAIRAGINDAFITVYRDGKKVYGAEANTLINQ